MDGEGRVARGGEPVKNVEEEEDEVEEEAEAEAGEEPWGRILIPDILTDSSDMVRARKEPGGGGTTLVTPPGDF